MQSKIASRYTALATMIRKLDTLRYIYIYICLGISISMQNEHKNFVTYKGNPQT